MPKRIDLDKQSPTLNELFKEADGWGNLPTKDLTADQIAILNLKDVIMSKSGAGKGPAAECFICATGA